MITKITLAGICVTLLLAISTLISASGPEKSKLGPWNQEIDPERYVDIYNYQEQFRDSRLDELIRKASKDRRITLQEEAEIFSLIRKLDKRP